MSRRKVALFNVIFEEDLVIFVSNEEERCVILANFINCRAISNAVSFKTMLFCLNEIIK